MNSSEKQDKSFVNPAQGEKKKSITDQYKSLDLTVSVLEYAKVYISLGLSVIPIAKTDKIPTVKWEKYQHEKPTEKELVEWFGNNDNNIGIVCGTVSGNLVVIDFDGEEIYQEFALKILDSGLSKKFDNTWIVKTKKGYHVYFRIDTKPETFRKVFRNKVKLVERVDQNGKVEQVDLRGEGGYVVAPPSIHPESTSDNIIHYEFIKGPSIVPEPAKLTIDEWNELLKLLGANPTKDLIDALNSEGKTQGGNTTQQELAPKTEQKPSVSLRPITGNSALRYLDDNKLSEIRQLIIGAWKKGQRQDLALFLSGWFVNARIHPVSIAKLFETIAIETNDNELNERLSAIYYTYRKAGYSKELEELDKYVEELQKKGLVRHVSKGENIDVSRIKGITGVQEILEREYGEEKALEIIRRISEILGVASPFRDSITIKTDFDTNLGYTNDMRRLRIYRCRIDEEEGIKIAKLVWEGAITKLTVIENPLGGVTEYEVVWERQNKDKPLIVRGTLDDIYERLREEGFLINTRLGKDALSSVVNGFINKGRAEIRRDIEAPGFYLVNGQLINIKYEVVDVSVEELKEALYLLNELATKWYSRAVDKFSTTIKWGIIAPFIFARKQLGRQFQVPHLCLYGARDAGKTTLAEIATVHLWGLNGIGARFVVGGPQSNTEARLGEIMRQSTFPVVINEANKMFENAGVVNMLKVSVESTVARGRFTKNGYTDILALSPLILTLNPTPPVNFDDLMLVPKTLFLMDFSEGERLSKERIEEFNKDVGPRLETLKAIGQYVAKIMLNGGIELLKMPWQTLSEELLKRAYKDAGLEPPQWVSVWYTTKSFEDVEEERLGRIRALMIDDINNRYARYVQRMVVESPEGNQYPVRPDMVSFEEKLNTLLRNNAIPYMILKNGKVLITSDIIYFLKLEVTNLRDLADLLGWAYNPRFTYRVNGKPRTRSVIEITPEQLVNFLIQNEDGE